MKVLIVHTVYKSENLDELIQFLKDNGFHGPTLDEAMKGELVIEQTRIKSGVVTTQIKVIEESDAASKV